MTEEEGIILVFVIPQVRNIFGTSQHFYIDGTFDAAPSFGEQCQQLFVIMGISYDVGFPLVYAQMSRKTEQTYNALFMYIKTIELTWQPQTIIMDFERASVNAIRLQFPRTRIVGRWFHSSQCLWRKI
ncbi:uncharacterized protein LOC126554368 [Aphis gossypii]|uniref:uncharacterized protein LOC126554368 n=1 Tax=Aphis gossypii TaxID=80765 RepID=UPI002159AFEA|nr:uncharacterized protein LOC126554368 [Aphis gossypii]